MSNQTVISIAPYWDVVHRHRTSFWLTMVVGLLITAVAVIWVPKQYTSTVVLEVRQPDIQANLITSSQSSPNPSLSLEARLDSLSQETVTGDHLKQLIAKYGLYRHHGVLMPGAVHQMANAISITIPDSLLQTITPTRWLKSLPPDVVQVSFQYYHPEVARAVASELGEIMITDDRKQREEEAAETVRLLTSELADTGAKLNASQQKIRSLKEKYRGSLPQDLETNVRAVEALEVQLDKAQQEENQPDAHYVTTSSGQKLVTPQAELAALQTKLLSLRTRYSDEYPEVIETKREIETTQNELASQKDLANSATDAAAANPNPAVGALQQQIADYQHLIESTPKHEEELAAVDRDYSILSGHYHDLTNSLFEARATQEVFETGQGERLRVLQAASLPTQPSYPNDLAMAGGGLGITLFIALAIPFGLFISDTSLKDSEDIKSEFADVAAIAISRVPEVDSSGQLRIVNRNGAAARPGLNNGASAASLAGHSNGSASHPSAKNGASVPTVAREHGAARFMKRYPAPPLVSAGDGIVTTASDEFQLLAFRLQMWASERKARVFVVASAVGGEGKSFVALNLAAALAASGSTALLIDGDFRAPYQHYSLDIDPSAGFLSFLKGTADINECVQATPIQGLGIVPAGGTCDRAPEYLSSQKMKEFMDALGNLDSFRYIIFDTPPALLVPDAQILAAAADGVVFVAAADSTARAAVSKALKMFDPASLFSMVLNRFEASYSTVRNEKYGRYGRYGRYGKYGKYAKYDQEAFRE